MQTAFVLALVSATVHGLGHLVSPPHRGYISQLPAFSTFVPPDFNDDELNAGGVAATAKGAHGVCGDAFDDQTPRAHETGGPYGLFPTFGKDVIGACYSPGQVVDLSVEITSNPTGYFQVEVCKLAGAADRETEACFQSLVQPNGQKQWQVPAGAAAPAVLSAKYRLPSGLVCDGISHCVLRWSWVVGPNTTSANAFEQYWNCADVYVSNTCKGATTTPAPTTKVVVTPAPTTTKAPTATPATTKPADGVCANLRNVCVWPLTGQTLPYSQADCLLFSNFVWCP